jgi:hypothetical protein
MADMDQEIIRDIYSIRDAVKLLSQRFSLLNEVVVERLPAQRYVYPWQQSSNGLIFTYQFFDKHGTNVAYYLVDFKSIHIVNRQWSLPKKETITLTGLLGLE